MHNCNPEETAGVRCITSGTVCTESQWRCEKTEACIAIEFLCDTVDDCEDRSDENRTRCQVFTINFVLFNLSDNTFVLV